MITRQPIEEGEDVFPFDSDYAACPYCTGPLVVLGNLGRRLHYRCRHCGGDCNVDVNVTRN